MVPNLAIFHQAHFPCYLPFPLFVEAVHLRPWAEAVLSSQLLLVMVRPCGRLLVFNALHVVLSQRLASRI
jgi:hypothetical protein